MQTRVQKVRGQDFEIPVPSATDLLNPDPYNEPYTLLPAVAAAAGSRHEMKKIEAIIRHFKLEVMLFAARD